MAGDLKRRLVRLEDKLKKKSKEEPRKLSRAGVLVKAYQDMLAGRPLTEEEDKKLLEECGGEDDSDIFQIVYEERMREYRAEELTHQISS